MSINETATKENKKVTAHIVAVRLRREIENPHSHLRFSGYYPAFNTLLEKVDKAGGFLPCEGILVGEGEFFRFSDPLVPDLPQISTKFLNLNQ